MKSLMVCLMSLLVFVQAGAAQQATVAGQVRLMGGLPVAGAQVLLFDLGDLRRGVLAQATTDADGVFALPLAALGGAFALPEGFVLGANYPNPFNPATVIPYQLAAMAQVRLEVFNALGQRMAVLVDGEQGAGTHSAKWDGTDASGRAAAAGVYVYRLTVDGVSQTGRMVLVDGQAGLDRLSPRSDASSLRAEPVEARPVEAAGSAYGLVVLGEGLVAYIDADFDVVQGMEPVVIEVDDLDGARGKAAQRVVQRLGDVDNDGRVTFSDALLVMAYSLNRATVMPDGGDISLGDVDGDGDITIRDAWLIATYVVDRRDDRVSGLGIGRSLGGPGAGGDLVADLPGGAEMEFVWIEPGVFQMGSPSSEPDRSSDEGPLHEVEISEGFWLGKYEVTQGEWESVMGSNPSHYTGDDRRPVEQISWNDVQGFIATLNDAAGSDVYRLPTEAEWEYACRAGTQTRWSLGDDDGDDESLLGNYAWYYGNNSPSGTKVVGQKEPSGWGLYDMHGNVWEWVQDWYGSYNSSRQVDPQGPSTGSRRVFRGGYFRNLALDVRSAIRHRDSPGGRGSLLGVRLLRISTP